MLFILRIAFYFARVSSEFDILDYMMLIKMQVFSKFNMMI